MTPSFKVEVSDLLANPGRQKELSDSGHLGEIATSLAKVPEDKAVSFKLMLESLGGDILVTGTLQAVWESECSRCLELIEGEIEMKLKERFQKDFVEGETYPLNDTHPSKGTHSSKGVWIDLGEMFMESIILSLPLAPICSVDCKGPVPEVFIELSDADTKDSRWDALKEFKGEDFKEKE